jgi:UDP-N-acetylglucosamine 2-epimerase (non-hydrolysing)
LRREGVAEEKIFFTGNVMIDSLTQALQQARCSNRSERLGLLPGRYVVLTLHRPSNVDRPEHLRETLEAIGEIAREVPVIFPVHPRTEAKINAAGGIAMNVWDGQGKLGDRGVWKMPPASYLDFVSWMDRAALVITDSGGIQDETTHMGVPCLTFRENTERQVTVTHGTNRVVGTDPQRLLREAFLVLNRGSDNGRRGERRPPLWDGHAAQRIVQIVRSVLCGRPVASPA